jgi:hypothetical protein
MTMKEPNDLGVAEDRRTWVGEQLGEGWAEVEPGIYRFTAGERLTESGIRMAQLPEEPDS